MKIIGITGSSGSGKTTVSNILKEKYFAKLIDADKVVKEMTVPGTEYMKQIEKNLGKEFIEEDGNLNKKKLAEKIYSNEEALSIINSLTFKYVVEEIKRRVIETSAEEEFVVVDAPLLIEANLDKLCDYKVAVLAEKEIKIERICKRDGLDRKTAECRLNIQKEDNFYIKNVDFIIYNNGTEDLEKEVSNIVRHIREIN